jgi:hypothetical protein
MRGIGAAQPLHESGRTDVTFEWTEHYMDGPTSLWENGIIEQTDCTVAYRASNANIPASDNCPHSMAVYNCDFSGGVYVVAIAILRKAD